MMNIFQISSFHPTLKYVWSGYQGEGVGEVREDLDSVVIQVHAVLHNYPGYMSVATLYASQHLDTDNQGGQPALAGGGHAVTLAHLEAAEHPLLQSQDLVHVVQELDAELVELARVVVPDPNQRLLVHRNIAGKVRIASMKLYFLHH